MNHRHRLVAPNLSTLVFASLIAGCGSGQSGVSSAAGGGTGQTGAGGQTTGAGGGAATCSNVNPCGGSVVGTWNVTSSSCLRLSGDMDVVSTSLGCSTVPITGTLNVNGTWTVNADGSYTDNTTTTGSITFPVAPACLSVSSVPVTCDRISSVFASIGWTSATCSSASGQCLCSATTSQSGGIGLISGDPATSGVFTTSGSMGSTNDGAQYSYCVSGNTLTMTPQSPTVTGTIVLQKSGTTGTGGASGSGGQPGTGGASSAGGAPLTGGAPSTGGAPVTSAGGKSNAGGAPPTGGKSGAGGATLTGGNSGVGGTIVGSGGATATGGKSSAGGATATGGNSGAGGTTTTGGSSSTAGATGTGPCDIYAAASTPCVAAHSTIRALFGAYSGKLYQVSKSGSTVDVSTLTPGGVADSSPQDTLCGTTGTSCIITKIYDQSGHGNDLEAEIAGSTIGGYTGESGAVATAESLNVGGHKVYSVFTKPKQAYWRNGSSSGMPLGANPQGVYMVTSGTKSNNQCCYDYGNGPTSRTMSGGGTMDAVYFGSDTVWGTGAGSGPWVMADLEGGLYSKGSIGQNTSDLSMTSTYVTAVEKNNGTSEMQLKGADATTGNLTTFYKGGLPYSKMQKQGSIILGSGGDCCYSNNNASQGVFYEGAIVNGYPTDAAENAVQANIVSANYGK